MRLNRSIVVAAILTCGTWVAPARSSAQSVLPPMSVYGLAPAHAEPAADTSPAATATDPAGAPDARTGAPATQPSGPASGAVNDPLYACACGCGVFDVGTQNMLPTGTGGLFYVNYAYQDQVTNWNGHTSAPPSQNPDKKIETAWYTPGIQYLFNRSWGIQAELPLAHRFFETTGGASGNDIVHSTWNTIGDLRVMGLYQGFFEDQSLGVNLGLKLPTGDYTHNNAYGDVDRDSEVGTGSTDVLVGGYYRHHLIAAANIDWFAQGEFDLPFLFRSDTSGTYRNGAEFDAAVGAYYTGLKVGKVTIIPLAQVLTSIRRQDSGSAAANPIGSGYQRILLSPGVEFDFHPFMFYADVELPVYQNTNGDQLVGSFLTKGTISYKF